MSNDEILMRIAEDVADFNFGRRGISIWMTVDLFKKLCPEQFMLHKDSAMITLFGCRIKVAIFPCGGMQWIVGYEGTAEDNEL